MRNLSLIAVVTMAAATPAHAGIAVPTPEAGAGIAAMGILAAGYAVLRRRAKRD